VVDVKIFFMKEKKEKKKRMGLEAREKGEMGGRRGI